MSSYYLPVIDECRDPRHAGCPDCEPPEEETTGGIEGRANILHRGHKLTVAYRYHADVDGLEIDAIVENMPGDRIKLYRTKSPTEHNALHSKVIEQARRDNA